jgi:hypothetical protein
MWAPRDDLHPWILIRRPGRGEYRGLIEGKNLVDDLAQLEPDPEQFQAFANRWLDPPGNIRCWGQAFAASIPFWWLAALADLWRRFVQPPGSSVPQDPTPFLRTEAGLTSFRAVRVWAAGWEWWPVERFRPVGEWLKDLPPSGLRQAERLSPMVCGSEYQPLCLCAEFSAGTDTLETLVRLVTAALSRVFGQEPMISAVNLGESDDAFRRLERLGFWRFRVHRVPEISPGSWGVIFAEGGFVARRLLEPAPDGFLVVDEFGSWHDYLLWRLVEELGNYRAKRKCLCGCGRTLPETVRRDRVYFSRTCARYAQRKGVRVRGLLQS